jgi:O-antigen ligase
MFWSQHREIGVRGLEISCGVAIAAALLMGGATQKGVASDAFVQLACLPLLACVILEYSSRRKFADPGVFLCTIAVAAIALQLVPLPPEVWAALPGRAAIVDAYHSAALPLPWSSLSISAWATMRVAFALLPALVIFLGVRISMRHERRRLALLILAFGVATVFVEIMQIVQGPGSALRFYAVTFREVGVGFFANRNHTAALLYATMPIAVCTLARSLRDRRSVAIWLGYLMIVWLGLMMTGSRSALLMGLASTIGAVALLIYGRIDALRRLRTADYAIAGGVVAATSALAAAFGLFGILARLNDERIVVDARWPIARASLSAAEGFFPVGSGLGTFERVYPLFEGSNRAIPAVINHAHNDLLELVIETGAIGALVIVGAIIFAAFCARRCALEDDLELAKERMAALFVMTLLFVHSLWDYPLRTSAIAAVFAFCCATTCAIPNVERREPARAGNAGRERSVSRAASGQFRRGMNGCFGSVGPR